MKKEMTFFTGKKTKIFPTPDPEQTKISSILNQNATPPWQCYAFNQNLNAVETQYITRLNRAQ